MTLSTILKTGALAGLIGLGTSLAATAPAEAATYRRCDADGCYRVHCDWRGYCYRYGDYYTDSYYAPYYDDRFYYRTVRVCDAWGCHWVRRAEPRVQVGVGLRF
jgi:hypothetical protein